MTIKLTDRLIVSRLGMTQRPSAATIASGDRGRFVLVRRLLLGLVLVGIVGLITELLLMEHFDEWKQDIPLVVLALGLVSTVWVVVRPTAPAVRIFQAVMAAFVLAGVVGLWFHYRGNQAFELEVAPSVRGTALIWKALRGAVPTLAPGALVQLGLLGLVWSHVSGTRGPSPTEEEKR
jgi:uncharacterized membrane protein YraQ (UPF0718 family)